MMQSDPMAMLGGRAADWRCPNEACMNSTKLVFAKHQSCPQCGAEKPEDFTPGIAAGGDWQCPNTDCKNHTRKVFASKTSCPMCGSEKPDYGALLSRNSRVGPY